ncbi:MULTISPECIES: AzlD domain-containing protein [unclassified Photobacterium]|uniref:AzlD domain-containing protein n=1 Tax=unclassified Photobacterium TaxID=2628852 RepID=UPI000D160773|nr:MULTISPECIES: AzlD domain-containing protein [unclassified Photobacterium]PSV27713.1 AzlD domain-containing protein [Photobacterium sp. GB-56]PSV31380.1 AzlD domain-containing protein [Photobacterium sp. GB-72]PSV31858.1 AzlD domain-containing protein [Photobacterium sp. GB-27]PSV38582.1 AzlD domain-containing protein [Photobacterium sp. GB-210]PSV45927.1 AzlD domain-containing protein [Photobacterium sp. GB-36]
MDSHTHIVLSNEFVIYLSLVMAVATFVIRFAVIGMAGRFNMSERFKKTLRFVPVTVLPAIIAVEILGKGSNFAFNLENPKVLAAIVCTIVSLRFGLIWVVISGLISLVIFQNYLEPITQFLTHFMA